MSRSADRRTGELARDDAGFTLLEIIVALGVVTTVMVALLPQLIVGIRSTGLAQAVTQAKGVAQGQLEQMRNLPFHVAPSAGEYVDLLDRFFPDRNAPVATPECRGGSDYRLPTTSWSGYVVAGAVRCDYEPTGPFYRTVTSQTEADGRPFTLVVDTQFLSAATPPSAVTPRQGYDAASNGTDTPPASQVGVTVTVFHTERGTPHPVSTYTQIARQLAAESRVKAGINVTALEVGSITTDQLPLSLSAGLVNINGSVAQGSTLSSNVAATTAGLANGDQQSGASTTAAAPPQSTALAETLPEGALTATGCSYACWGQTQISGFTASAENGLLNAGTSLAPLQAAVTSTANSGISFGNSADATAYRADLKLQPPLLRLDASATLPSAGLVGCTTAASGHVAASGFVSTTTADGPAASDAVDACAVARTTRVSLFPTAFAPKGVVRIELQHAYARCTVEGSAHTATVTYNYQATVEYWNGTEYVTAATIVPGMTIDPLEAVLSSDPAVSDTKHLSDYIASWSSLTSDKVTAAQPAGSAELSLPGVVTIASQPVRADSTASDGLDASSVVSVTAGALSCSAEDAR